MTAFDRKRPITHPFASKSRGKRKLLSLLNPALSAFPRAVLRGVLCIFSFDCCADELLTAVYAA